MRISKFGLTSLVALVLVLAQLAWPISANAQSKKELAAQAIQLSNRLTIMEKRILTGDPAAEQLMQRMDSLEASQRTITGEVERLRHERDTLQEEVRALASSLAEMQTITSDMQRHLKAVDIVSNRATASVSQPSQSISSRIVPGSRRVIADTGPITSTAPVYGGSRIGGGTYSNGSSISNPPSVSSVPYSLPSSNDISQLGKIGIEKMQEGNFGEAQSSFLQYLEHNPDATDRGDIYFWLGETYYVKGGYADAADAYIASMRAQPKGDYAPEALVRLAGTARALGKNTAACQTINSFTTQYPNATPAVRAKARSEKQRSGC